MTFRILPALAAIALARGAQLAARLAGASPEPDEEPDFGLPPMPSLEEVASAEAAAAVILLYDFAMTGKDARGQTALNAALARRGISFHEGTRGTIQ